MKYNFLVRKLFCCILIITPPLAIFSQMTNATIEKMIDNEVDSIRKGSIRGNNYVFDSTNAKHFLNYIKKYENDPHSNVYFLVQRLRILIAEKTNDTLVRQEIVDDFVGDCLKSDPAIYQYSLARLVDFKEKDFSLKSKKMLFSVFQQKSSEYNLYLVCGIAQVKDLIPKLKEIAIHFDRKKSGWWRTDGWYASLALARMGDSSKIDNIIAAIELELDSNTRIKKILPLIAYTRHPDCIRLLEKYLEMTAESLPMLSEGDIGLVYNQYAMNYLVKNLDDFPVKNKGKGMRVYSKEEIDIARKFLKDNYSINPKYLD